ncbi:MAG: peptide chain release factor 3 [Rhodospirillales bacterium]|nr:peptide chain release factor 3 [Rhodospirillales bacterium]MCB9973666.1 peptide chain release factor 3 [Rhodospirillales bacterium]MCB9980637.1 peptide chain release factor 3 [Rhodospirillales bacterium]
MSYRDIIQNRRTFAIISHPDAGKTTLTEKLLLFGGAIQLAGEVKARGDRRRARSDWMKVEQERGISVASSVMTFENKGITYNLLDTPGHEDFSEDTYRTLTAVDSAIMVLDAAKGIEPQTLKLFEVCRLRDIPIITFVNKMDRDGQDPFDLIDEVEQRLALDITPATWPIGMGRDFKGCYNLLKDELILFDRGKGDHIDEAITCTGLDDPKIEENLEPHQVAQLREDVAMIRGVCPQFEEESYRQGHLSPMFFGSAINNFGVQELLGGLSQFAPCPQPLKTEERIIEPTEKKVTGFVFKIQANMDPKHRDRIAFTRICSGNFKKGMKLKHVRSGKNLTIHSPLLFLAQDRAAAEDAYAGDIIGIVTHGGLRIGDALTEGEDLTFTGIPNFAPELMQRVRPDDPLKAKHLGAALQQIAEEGGARVFKPLMDSAWVVGVVGSLQFEVLADRIRTEYNIPVKFEATQLYTARWVSSADHTKLKNFVDSNRSSIAYDHDEDPVFLARNAWHLQDAQDKNKDITFAATK